MLTTSNLCLKIFMDLKKSKCTNGLNAPLQTILTTIKRVTILQVPYFEFNCHKLNLEAENSKLIKVKQTIG